MARLAGSNRRWQRGCRDGYGAANRRTPWSNAGGGVASGHGFNRAARRVNSESVPLCRRPKRSDPRSDTTPFRVVPELAPQSRFGSACAPAYGSAEIYHLLLPGTTTPIQVLPSANGGEQSRSRGVAFLPQWQERRKKGTGNREQKGGETNALCQPKNPERTA